VLFSTYRSMVNSSYRVVDGDTESSMPLNLIMQSMMAAERRDETVNGTASLPGHSLQQLITEILGTL